MGVNNKRMVQCLLDHNIVSVQIQFRQKRPSFCVPLKAVSCLAAVSNPDDLAGLLTHHGSQQIDVPNHPMQIVLGWPIEQAHLHIHHNNRIHGLFLQFNETLETCITSLPNSRNPVKKHPRQAFTCCRWQMLRILLRLAA